MASIKLTGDTSGEITIAAPAVAGTNTLTLPAASGNILTDGAVANNGIYLGGTASANLLDDYEYGTFNPNFSEGGNTLTTSSQSGQYVKVGKMVFAYMQAGNITKSGTGNLNFDLPFVVDGFATGNVHWNRLNFATNDRYVSLYAFNNNSGAGLYFTENGNVNASTVTASDIADGSNADVVASITYKTD